MRPIKFRAWIHGRMQYTFFRITSDGLLEDNHGPIKGELMQFTGLLDKKKTDMYFGDLVKKNGDDRVYQIAPDVMGGAYPHHDDIYKSFGPKCSINFYPVTGGTNVCEEWEIIGNIYENPELLTTSNPQ